MTANRMNKSISLALLLVFLAATISFAQTTGRNVAERAGDRSQISQGQKMLERDQKELEAFKKQIAELEKIFANQDLERLNALTAELIEDLTREVSQSNEKAEQAQRELVASRSEVRSDRREVVGDRDDANRGGYTSDDHGDLRRDQVNRADDRRDAGQDNADLQAIVKRAERQQQILEFAKAFDFTFENEMTIEASANAKNQYNEFSVLMEQDLAQTQKEIAEDRQEAGEDRRETRDDVRESDELDNRARRRR